MITARFKVRTLNLIGEELISDNLEKFISEHAKQIDLSNISS